MTLVSTIDLLTQRKREGLIVNSHQEFNEEKLKALPFCYFIKKGRELVFIVLFQKDHALDHLLLPGLPYFVLTFVRQGLLNLFFRGGHFSCKLFGSFA